MQLSFFEADSFQGRFCKTLERKAGSEMRSALNYYDAIDCLMKRGRLFISSSVWRAQQDWWPAAASELPCKKPAARFSIISQANHSGLSRATVAHKFGSNQNTNITGMCKQ